MIDIPLRARGLCDHMCEWLSVSVRLPVSVAMLCELCVFPTMCGVFRVGASPVRVLCGFLSFLRIANALDSHETAECG